MALREWSRVGSGPNVGSHPELSRFGSEWKKKSKTPCVAEKGETLYRKRKKGRRLRVGKKKRARVVRMEVSFTQRPNLDPATPTAGFALGSRIQAEGCEPRAGQFLFCWYVYKCYRYLSPASICVCCSFWFYATTSPEVPAENSERPQRRLRRLSEGPKDQDKIRSSNDGDNVDHA
ncbi:hypothetical protein CRG98_023035 [Punica granatum]|uniref:Uncharacterized protein n=1 Tax=Punica granatum TaxID=22663 RepID=A0A2I0JM24_PUNGR|nr:hypothetical protein CRG98_023035 [Punica granatum]